MTRAAELSRGLWRPYTILDPPVDVGAMDFAWPTGAKFVRVSGAVGFGATGVNLSLRIAYDGVPNYRSDTNYEQAYVYGDGSTAVSNSSSVVSEYAVANGVDNISVAGMTELVIFQGGSSWFPRFMTNTAGRAAGRTTNVQFGGLYANNVAISHVRLFTAAANAIRGDMTRLLVEAM